MVRPLLDWMAARGELVDVALRNTADRYELETGEAFVATYNLSAIQPTVTVTATINVQKIYNPETKAFTLVADSNPDNPAPPVDESQGV